MGETSGSQRVSTKLQRIAKLAKAAPDMALTTLAHHIACGMRRLLQRFALPPPRIVHRWVSQLKLPES